MINIENIFLWLFLIFEALLFIISGILIIIQRHKRALRVRTPILLQISHWSNFLEDLIVLYVLDQYENYSRAYHWSYSLCIIVHFLIHFLFFIPFLLRSYRLYLIFYIDKNWDTNDKNFRKRLKRTKEKWLLKVLGCIATPFIMVSVSVYSMDNSLNFFQIQNSSENNKYGDSVNGVALFITFLEQMCSIFAINAIRDVSDDFNMCKELILVNLTWIITSPNLIISNYSSYSYQILVRNNIVLLITTLYPLYKSFQKECFDVPMTEEVLDSLQLVFNNKISLEAFENFLKNSEIQFQKKNGYEYLSLWIKCEYYRHMPNTELFINKSASSLEIEASDFNGIQMATYGVMEKIFFPLFKHSKEYSACLRRVNMQNLVNSRLLLTSFGSLYPGN